MSFVQSLFNMQLEQTSIHDQDLGREKLHESQDGVARKKVVVVGLGMVGISFM